MVGAAILAQVHPPRSLDPLLAGNRSAHVEPAADTAEEHKLAAGRVHLRYTRASVAAAERVLEAVRRPCGFAAVRDLRRTAAAADIVARGAAQGNHAAAADRDLHCHVELHSPLHSRRASDSDLRNHAAGHLHGPRIRSAALCSLHMHFDVHRHALAAAHRDLRRTRRTLRHNDVPTHGREIHVKSLTHDVHAFHDAFRACSTRDVPLSVDRCVADK